MKTGWSRAEILALPPSEFHHYLALLTPPETPDGRP